MAFEARLRASIAVRDAETGNGIPPRQTFRRRPPLGGTTRLPNRRTDQVNWTPFVGPRVVGFKV
jgi:hypothetical protein